ncbi:hypothetical protein GCM10023238_32390 [Streptomyces heliomycini]
MDGVVAHSDRAPAPRPRHSRRDRLLKCCDGTLRLTTANLHYQPAGGSWPNHRPTGVGMEAACAWLVEAETVGLGSATIAEGGLQQRQRDLDNNNARTIHPEVRYEHGEEQHRHREREWARALRRGARHRGAHPPSNRRPGERDRHLRGPVLEPATDDTA